MNKTLWIFSKIVIFSLCFEKAYAMALHPLQKVHRLQSPHLLLYLLLSGIDLLVLDVIMPLKNEKEVYAEARKIKADIKAIFLSGYIADVLEKKGILENGMNFLSKPVLPNKLLMKVRNVLDN